MNQIKRNYRRRGDSNGTLPTAASSNSSLSSSSLSSTSSLSSLYDSSCQSSPLIRTLRIKGLNALIILSTVFLVQIGAATFHTIHSTLYDDVDVDSYYYDDPTRIPTSSSSYHQQNHGNLRGGHRRLSSSSSNIPQTSPFCGVDGAGPYYGIVIDAASSGSRIRVFSWQNATSPIYEVVPDDDEHLYKTKPGLSSFADRNGGRGAGESLKGLIEAAKTLIPAERWHVTPLYVQATAGLRLLTHKQARSVLKQTRQYLQDDQYCPFDVKSVETITGQVEGFYAYLSVNDGVPDKGGLKHWNGLLDLGGASTQLTFYPQRQQQHPQQVGGGSGNSNAVVEATEEEQEERMYGFEWRGNHYNLYSHSYLDYGLNAAMKRYKSALVKKQRPSVHHGEEISSPCHNPGYIEEYEFVTSLSQFTRSANKKHVKLVGTGNATECQKYVEALLYLDDSCTTEKCPKIGFGSSGGSGGGDNKPTTTTPTTNMNDAFQGDFYALSAFFYVAYNLKLVDWAGSVSLKPSQLSTAGSQFCSQTLSPQSSTYDLEKDTCFQTLFASAILTAYGLEEYTNGKLVFTRTIGGEGRHADWTLGSILHARENTPCTSEATF